MTAFLVSGLLLLAAPPNVHPGGAVLRDSCSAEAGTLARLEAGEAVTVRFAFSGDLGTCYKVEAQGKTGYVTQAELVGMESYEKARASANDRSMPQMIRAEITRLKEEATGSPRGAGSGGFQLSGQAPPSVQSAIRLLESSQPKEALSMLETEILRGRRQDPFLLSLAGVAAYQSDQPRRAVEFWTDSLAIRPNPSIEAMMKKAQRELAADTSRSKVHGDRFVLRYNDSELTRDQAGEVMNALNDEFRRIDQSLGCGVREQITAVVMTRDTYTATTGAAEWSGGQFDGRIRVCLTPREGVTARVRQTFAHEIVHACLASNGRFPGWFHEGMAQRWSGEQPGASTIAAARARLRSKHMPSLNNLGPTFSQLSAQHAELAYAYAFDAVETLYRLRGADYVRGLVRDPASLPAVADQLTQSMAQ